MFDLHKQGFPTAQPTTWSPGGVTIDSFFPILRLPSPPNRDTYDDCLLGDHLSTKNMGLTSNLVQMNRCKCWGLDDAGTEVPLALKSVLSVHTASREAEGQEHFRGGDFIFGNGRKF